MEKRLGSLVLEGATLISLDNCEDDIGGELLCQIMTQQLVRIRILGVSQTPACRWRGTIGGNGNNIGVRSDMARRTLIANLDANLERPEQRSFEKNPIRMIQENRGALYRRRPDHRARLAAPPVNRWAKASFRSSRQLRGMGRKPVRLPLIWLDRDDLPVERHGRGVREDDPDQINAKTLFSLVASRLLPENPPPPARCSTPPHWRTRPEATLSFTPSLTSRFFGGELRGGGISVNRVGRWLKGLRNQIHGDAFGLWSCKKIAEPRRPIQDCTKRHQMHRRSEVRTYITRSDCEFLRVR